MGSRIELFDLSGARVFRLFWEGSSMLTLILSASVPKRFISSGSAPGMVFA